MRESQEKKIVPDVSAQVKELSRVLSDDAKDYFKELCALMILEYGSHERQVENMTEGLKRFVVALVF